MTLLHFKLKRVLIILIVSIMLGFASTAFAADQGTMFWSGTNNGFGADPMTYLSGPDTWVVTIQASSNNSSAGFLFRDSSTDFNNKWARGNTVSFETKTTWYWQGGDGTYNQTNGNYYTLTIKDVADGANSEGFLFETSGTPVSISSTTRSSTNICPAQSPTITANLSGSLPSGQAVWLRYTNDNFSSSTIVKMTGSGTTYTAPIPANTNVSNANIIYYTFTSGDMGSISASDADLATINLDNNGGSNYSYTVASSWSTTQDSSWSTASTWACGEVPASSQPVTIDNHVTLDQDATISSLTINSGQEFTASDATARTLTIASAGSLTNNGTFTAGSGKVAFAGTGTVSGGATAFNDVDISGGVNFGSSLSTINGTLAILSGGYVNTNPPTYGSGSTLHYKTGSTNLAPYGRSTEWSATSGAGYPHHVRLSNDTHLNLGANGIGTARQIAGNLTIEDTSGLFMDFGTDDMTASLTVKGDVTLSAANAELSLSNLSGGDLNVQGNWTNNGTFNANNRTVTFNGSSGTQNVSGNTTFYNLTLDHSSATTDFGSATITIANAFRVDAGTMQEGTSSFTFTGSSGSIAGSNTKRFYDLMINSGASIDNTTGGNLEVSNDFTNNGTLNSSQTITFKASGDADLFGSGTTTFNGVVVQGSTTLKAGSHNFTVTGDFQVSSGGSFDGGTATVTFDGNTTLLGTGSFLFNNIVIASGKSLTGHSSNSMNLKGNWTNNGTFTPNSGTIIFNGSSAQTIGGTSSTTFNNLTINNTSGGVSLTSTQTVNGTLTLSSGLLSLGSNNLTIASNNAVAGTFNNTKMIVADGTGQLRKAFSANGSFTFPIGDNSSPDGAQYTPAVINVTGSSYTSAYLAVNVNDAKHPQNTVTTDYLTRYWTVTSEGTIADLSANVTFTYDQLDVQGTEGNIYGAKYDGSWTLLNQADTANNQLSGTVTGFSDFTGGDSTLPVTLSSFHATKRGDATHFEWQTATETAVLGYNIYAESASGLAKVNEELILATGISSLEPQSYQYTASGVTGTRFYIEDVGYRGFGKRFGPFSLEQQHGQPVVTEAVDWDAIQHEHQLKAEARLADHVVMTQEQLNRIREGRAALSTEPLMQLTVESDGLYRLTHEQLLAAGLDLSGTPASDIALSNRGNAVSITMGGSSTFGTGSYIEFVGTALDTLYTKANVYTLSLNPALASRIQTDHTAPTGAAAAYYMETATVAENTLYDVVASGDDPWYHARLVAVNGATTRNFTIDVDHYLAGAAPATLELEVWGGTHFAETPDHHLVVNFEGTTITDLTFDGLVTQIISEALPEGLLQEGSNTLQLKLPHDLGLKWDVVGVEEYSLTYPRAFVARDNGLTFDLPSLPLLGGNEGGHLEVTGLDSPNIVVYRLDQNGSSQLTNVTVSADGGSYRATFAGSDEAARYIVSTQEALLTPTLTPARPFTDITSGSAPYLMLAHPDFIDALTPLINFHQQRGLTVRVVNVFDVYDQFSDSLFDPQAIKDYLAHAQANMGTEYVLLVGGDTYDYHDYKGLGSISFIPSLYMATDHIVEFAPVDPLYADVDGDNVPDMKIGRFPVRTSAELETLIANTLAYTTKSYNTKALLAADKGYTTHSDELGDYLPDSWQVEEAYLDQLEVEDAKSVIIDEINEGTALAAFFGHSGPTNWTFEGLFNADDAAALTNTDKPTIVAQFGCWNNYYVSPSYNTLAHKFMLSGNQGAAVVLGASTLTQASNDKLLGDLVMARIAETGMTIGEALHAAKAELATNYPGLTDVQLGYTILGDPALQVSPDIPLGVQLATFEANAEREQIVVNWQTVSEQNNLGFNLYRTESPPSIPPNFGGEEMRQLNPSLIPAQAPGSGQGSPYEWQDETVEAGQTYYYWLEDVSLNGETRLHGPISTTANIPTAIHVESLGSTTGSPLWALLPLGLLLLVGLAGIVRKINK